MNFCKVHGHKFPVRPDYEMLASAGRRLVWSCNNCLTIKVRFRNDVKVNGEWTVIETEHIVDDGTIDR